MGWGCYKHEMDAGSDEWQEKIEQLSTEKLKEDPRTWGRDGEVCPSCWEEMEARLKAAELQVRVLRSRATALLAEIAADSDGGDGRYEHDAPLRRLLQEAGPESPKHPSGSGYQACPGSARLGITMRVYVEWQLRRAVVLEEDGDPYEQGYQIEIKECTISPSDQR